MFGNAFNKVSQPIQCYIFNLSLIKWLEVQIFVSKLNLSNQFSAPIVQNTGQNYPKETIMIALNKMLPCPICYHILFVDTCNIVWLDTKF